jgi:hypothetical protein
VCTNRIYLDGEFLYHVSEPITHVFFVDKGIVQLASNHLAIQLVNRGSLGHAGLFTGTNDNGVPMGNNTIARDNGMPTRHDGTAPKTGKCVCFFPPTSYSTYINLINIKLSFNLHEALAN